MSSWLLLAVVVMSAAVVATILATAIRKRIADVREARYQATLEQVRPAVFTFVASDGLDALPLAATIEDPRRAVQRSRRTAANELLIDYAGKLRGEVVERIRQFFTEHGFADEAVADLDARSPWLRAKAVQELGFIASPTFVPALVKRLTDRDDAVRIVAARALGSIGDPAAARPLLESQDAARQIPYGPVSQALLRLGAPAVPALLEGLRHPSFRVRRLAVDVLGELSVRRAEAPLVDILRHDRDVIVRIRAAAALGKIGTAETLSDLYASMRDENADLRQSIIRAVASIGARGSLAVLRRALEDTDHSTARLAARALYDFGPAGEAVLKAAAVGATRGSLYAIEILDEHHPVSDRLRAQVRRWDPLVVAEPLFPTTGRTQR